MSDGFEFLVHKLYDLQSKIRQGLFIVLEMKVCGKTGYVVMMFCTISKWM